MMDILANYRLTQIEKDFIWFDCEGFNSGNDYIVLIHQLLKISTSDFLAQSICIENEGWINNKEFYIVIITIELNNIHYKIRLLCQEWFDFDLVTQLNNILRKHGKDKQFYPLITGDQSLVIVFGNTCLKKQLEKDNILESIENLKLDKPINFNSLKIC